MIRYTSTVRRATPAREHGCGLCGRPATGWDHCHTHGWIRGPLCASCNQLMSHTDDNRKGIVRPDGRPRGRGSWAWKLGDCADALVAAWISNCIDCKETS